MPVLTILEKIRETAIAMLAPGADMDALRAKKGQLQQELNDTISNLQVMHMPVVDERLQAYCDSLLSDFNDVESAVYRQFANDLRDVAGTIYQQAIHDKLVKLYGPTYGAERVSDAYRMVTAGV